MTGEGNPQRVFTFFKSIGLIRFYLLNLTSQDYRVLRDCLVNLHSILTLGNNFKVAENNNSGNSSNIFVLDIINNGGITIF